MGGQQVYVIQNELGPVKIGIADRPRQRLRELQVGSPFELKIRQTATPDDAKAVETYLHDVFRRYSLRGEWFDIPPKELDFDIPTTVDDSGEVRADIERDPDRDINHEWSKSLDRFFRVLERVKYLSPEVRQLRADTRDLSDVEFDTKIEANKLPEETNAVTALDDTPEDKKRCSQCGHLFDRQHGTCPTCSSGDVFDQGYRHNYRR